MYCNVFYLTHARVMHKQGLDIPALDTCLLLTPRSGENVLTQVVGRLLRDGGRTPLMIDFIDSYIPLFQGMRQKRKKTYQKMGASITMYDIYRNEVSG